MKIYSWNMLFSNRELDRAFEFIAHADFDIFCLQEVPEGFLTRLKSLPFSIVAAPEMEFQLKNTRSTEHAVILSKHTMRTTGEIPLPYRDPGLPLRGKLFISLMFATRTWAKGLGNRHALYADIETPHGIIRVFNIHLTLAHPAWRLEEFEMTLAERDPALPTIVCGDFNILEWPHITPLSWILGGRLTDVLFYKRERTRIEKRFVEYELHNPLRGKVTHPLSRSQLDHILISNSFLIKKTEVIPDRYGSDHHPIFVELT